VTGGHKRTPIFDDDEYQPKEVRSKPQGKPKKVQHHEDDYEEAGYNGFENFDAFNKFVGILQNRQVKKTTAIRAIVILTLPLKMGGKRSH
jgi:hypothetical protein